MNQWEPIPEDAETPITADEWEPMPEDAETTSISDKVEEAVARHLVRHYYPDDINRIQAEFRARIQKAEQAAASHEWDTISPMKWVIEEGRFIEQQVCENCGHTRSLTRGHLDYNLHLDIHYLGEYWSIPEPYLCPEE